MTDQPTTTEDDAVEPDAFPGGETLHFNHHVLGDTVTVVQPVLAFHPYFLVESKEGDEEDLAHHITVGGGPQNKEQVLQWLEIIRQLIVDEVVPLVEAYEPVPEESGDETDDGEGP